MKKKYDLSNLPEGFKAFYKELPIYECKKFHVTYGHTYVLYHTFVPYANRLKLRLL